MLNIWKFKLENVYLYKIKIMDIKLELNALIFEQKINSSLDKCASFEQFKGILKMIEVYEERTGKSFKGDIKTNKFYK